MLENIRLALEGIWAHKLRSALTMLGIIIGIASIISIVSTIKGTNDQIKQNLIGSGKNTVNVRLFQGEDPWDISEGVPAGLYPVQSKALADIEKLDGVEGATAYNARYSTGAIYCADKSASGLYIYGTDLSFLSVCGYRIRTGRPFMESDYDEFRTVALLDTVSAKTLFREENPVGKEIEISGTPFTVIGVVKDEHVFEPTINSMEDYVNYNQDSSGKIMIPQSAWAILYSFDEPENVVIKVKTTDKMTKAGKKASDILNEYVSVKNGEIKYAAEDLLEQASQMQQLNSASNHQLLWIAGISLLVGGIGVMNIMLVSVTERTSEIGLKKAIGAKKKTILAQFLTEAAVLTSLGGLIGVVFGVAAAYIIQHISGTPAAIDYQMSAIAVVFSMAIGLLFGFLPSWQAANMDPIEALRRE